jgi:plasmid stabilization system protein ParE
MRRIVFAPSFDRELEEIGFYIEEQFGEEVRRYFIGDIAATCDARRDKSKVSF